MCYFFDSFIRFGDLRSALLFHNVFVAIIMRNGLLIRAFMYAKKRRSLNDNRNEMLRSVEEVGISYSDSYGSERNGKK